MQVILGSETASIFIEGNRLYCIEGLRRRELPLAEAEAALSAKVTEITNRFLADVRSGISNWDLETEVASLHREIEEINSFIREVVNANAPKGKSSAEAVHTGNATAVSVQLVPEAAEVEMVDGIATINLDQVDLEEVFRARPKLARTRRQAYV